MALRATVRPSQVKPQAEVQALKDEIRRHIKMCAACTHAKTDTRRWCDDRWQREKALKRLQNAAGAAAVRAAVDQPALPFGQSG